VNADFISKVRYILTKKERKIFLELALSEREQFIEKFWERRDPDPDTEENEFKMGYLNRVEKTSELFVSEVKLGWLTDRGRICFMLSS
jgi:GWxTD domain-containing protein